MFSMYSNYSHYSKKEKHSELSLREQQELLSEFCESLLDLKNKDEAVNFLIDLLTKSEALMLAKRIAIAKLLLNGKHYREIEKALKVSHGTITKVAQWLAEGGEGFRVIVKRAKKRRPRQSASSSVDLSEWGSLKRRYPSMFWPELLIEEVIKSANKRQKQKIYNALKKLDKKSKIYCQTNSILKKYYQISPKRI